MCLDTYLKFHTAERNFSNNTYVAGAILDFLKYLKKRTTALKKAYLQKLFTVIEFVSKACEIFEGPIKILYFRKTTYKYVKKYANKYERIEQIIFKFLLISPDLDLLSFKSYNSVIIRRPTS